MKDFSISFLSLLYKIGQFPATHFSRPITIFGGLFWVIWPKFGHRETVIWRREIEWGSNNLSVVLIHRYLMIRLSLKVVYLWRHASSTAPPFILWWWNRSSPFIGELRCQAIQMEHALQSAVYILRWCANWAVEMLQWDAIRKLKLCRRTLWILGNQVYRFSHCKPLI
jgi:hypothetical protein